MSLPEKYRAHYQDMMLGIHELHNWLQDAASQGLAQLHQQDSTYFEQIAGRLHDLRLSGIARRIRNLASRREEVDWLDYFQEELASFYLFVQAFRMFPALPEPTQMDLLLTAGLSLRKKDVLASEPPVNDQWIVLGQEFGKDDRIRYRRTWLWGLAYQDAALLLDFAWGNQAFEGYYVVGSAIEASLHFYPGAMPLRALIGSIELKNAAAARIEGMESIEQFIFQYTRAIRDLYRVPDYPVLLSKVFPFQEAGKWFIADKEQKVIPLKMEEKAAWKLLATSGGQAIMLFGIWDGESLQALSMIHQERIISLQ